MVKMIQRLFIVMIFPSTYQNFSQLVTRNEKIFSCKVMKLGIVIKGVQIRCTNWFGSYLTLFGSHHLVG